MPTPILATKLYIPPPRPNFVARPRLIERLNSGLHRKLTLISAPAGFGKTTLVSEWVSDFRLPISDFGLDSLVGESIQNPKLVLKGSAIQNRVAWLSLDEGDNDPTHFLSYVVAALQVITPNLGSGVLAALQSAQPLAEPSGREAILTALLNEITTLPHKFILVLDDYHLIDAKVVDQALTFLLDHLPPQMHLVITTREDPHLPLARYRAQGQLTEVRAADLRFTTTEAAEFLNQVMGLTLTVADIAALEARTEGWIAGLQLAALSVQGRPDIPGFIRAFTGDNRYIVDYLVEEVLQRQPPLVRSFLLQTAILDRLSGPLCDAVTQQADGSEMLAGLERANLFVVPLDDKRHWYRYHHLFAEVLSAHLRAKQSDQIATLHQRASVWYEQHGSPPDAIRHALAAADFARTAALIERFIPTMRRSRQEATLLGWLRALPAELLQTRPVLSVYYAGALLQSGELDGIEARLHDAERWLNPGLDTGLDTETGAVVVNQEEFRHLPGLIAVYRAGHALALGDVTNTVKYAQQALDRVAEDDHLLYGAATALLGLAYWASGDLNAAHRTYADGMARVQKAGHLSDVISGAIARADLRIAQGRLHAAMGIYEQALQLAMAQGEPLLRGTADLYVGMSELSREYNDLPTATQQLLRSRELGERTGFPQNWSRWHVAMARIRAAQGDREEALTLLQEAERLYVSDFYPNVRPVAAVRTRLWIAQGRLGEALDWARARGLSIDDELSYLREFEHITLARLLLSQVQHDHVEHALLEAMAFLARLLPAAEAGGRIGSMIEILILQALAHQAQGDMPAALLSLKRALTLAEPAGYIRIFADEGQPMRFLILDFGSFQDKLWITQQLGIEQNMKLTIYTDRILAALGNEPLSMEQIQNPKSKIQNLVEPLSQRELEVLRLFKTELSGPEIAQELVVALSTVRTHTKSIYSKLNVNNRRAAVNRAVELNLL
jgi:LuxR family maltose regulon positive regulatory protein